MSHWRSFQKSDEVEREAKGWSRRKLVDKRLATGYEGIVLMFEWPRNSTGLMPL